jgi:hypothetical protein
MVENTFVEMGLFFIIGLAGSATQLFIILLVSGDIRIIRNKVIPATMMAILFILVGGIVTLIYASTFQTPLIPSGVWKVFIVGLGWQGIVVSYAIAKKADEGEDAGTLKAANNKLEARIKDLEGNLKGNLKSFLGQ